MATKLTDKEILKLGRQCGNNNKVKNMAINWAKELARDEDVVLCVDGIERVGMSSYGFGYKDKRRKKND